MMILNESLEFASVDLAVRQTFRGQQGQKKLLPANHLLYKFTSFPLFKPDGGVTPFWSSVKPIDPSDPGLAGNKQRATALNCTPAIAARSRAAVTHGGNSMSGLLKARLLRPVYAFVGQCSGQAFDKSREHSNVALIGGAWQLWIPGLDTQHIVREPSA